jgi:hypothetical protein
MFSSKIKCSFIKPHLNSLGQSNLTSNLTITSSNVNRFEFFRILDAIPCCGISNLFWWFEILGHYFVVLQVFLCVHIWCGFLCFYVLGLDTCVVASEFFCLGWCAIFRYYVVILFLCMDNNRCRCQYGSTQH